MAKSGEGSAYMVKRRHLPLAPYGQRKEGTAPLTIPIPYMAKGETGYMAKGGGAYMTKRTPTLWLPMAKRAVWPSQRAGYPLFDHPDGHPHPRAGRPLFGHTYTPTAKEGCLHGQRERLTIPMAIPTGGGGPSLTLLAISYGRVAAPSAYGASQRGAHTHPLPSLAKGLAPSLGGKPYGLRERLAKREERRR